jgi:hypothetical protein
MSKTFSISEDEILHQVKLSCLVPHLVERILSRQIIVRTAQENGIEITSTELQQAADMFRLTNKLESVGQTWLWLQKQGLSLDDFEEFIYTSVVSSKLAQHLFAERVESFFIENKLDYTQIVMYEIVLDDEDLALELFCAIESIATNEFNL